MNVKPEDRALMPSTPFKKDELRELAVHGARSLARDLERQLARLHKEFPEVFAAEIPPAFVKAERKTRGGGDWPMPMRRKKKPRKVKRPAHLPAPVRRTQTGPRLWEKAQQFLLEQDGHRATAKMMKAALGMSDAAVAMLVHGKHGGFFRRVDKGVYELTKVGMNGTAG